MCGRFTLHTPLKALMEYFQFVADADLLPSYNIAPTQVIATVREMEGGGALDVPGRG